MASQDRQNEPNFENQQVSFKYVYIPADTSEDIEERTFLTNKKDECAAFITALQKYYKRASGPRSAAQRAAQKQALKHHMGDKAAGVSDGMLGMVADTQLVEPIALVAQAPETGFVGVYLYCDDQAAIKQLPLNPRATGIANAAGLHIQVLGDAFLGRYRDNEAADDFARLDFTQEELSSSAPWVAEAQAQMRRRTERSGDTQQLMQRLQQQTAAAASTGRATSSSTTASTVSPADQEKARGNAAFAKGDWQLALEHYTAALRLEPSNIAAQNNRAMAYLKIGRFAEAAADCTSVLQASPNNVKALLRRATAFQGLNQLPEAAADLQQVLQLEGNNSDAASRLAAIEEQQQQQQQQQQVPEPAQLQQQEAAAGTAPASAAVKEAAAVEMEEGS